jgi:diamine N-acetyltransferase
MEELHIRRVRPGEVEALAQIARKTFTDTFAAVNTKEDMQHYIDNSLSFAKLTEEVNNESSQFYFALVDDAIVGYLKLNLGSAQTEQQDGNTLEIERIYVLQSYHGLKVGQALCDYALSIATDMAADYIWLGVWEENFRAIRFYTKNGFVPFDTHIFMLGSDVQTDILMKREC